MIFELDNVVVTEEWDCGEFVGLTVGIKESDEDYDTKPINKVLNKKQINKLSYVFMGLVHHATKNNKGDEY